jgi:peptidoglycan/LPS O-acetylase OafA/YrhL
MVDERVVLFSAGVYGLLFVLMLKNIKFEKIGGFLSEGMTGELRGIGILLVVIGHIGVHVLGSSSNFLVLSSFGVSLFFILSGFGLSRSYLKKKLVLREFAWNRINRVMIPYWLTTLLIFVLDYLVLAREYDFGTIILTLLGINLSLKAQLIDYVRWYITVQIMWYLVFFIVWPKFGPTERIIAFTIVGLVSLLLSYYWVPTGYAFLSFPFGIFLGLQYGKIESYYNRTPSNRLFITALGLLVGTCALAKYSLPHLMGIIPGIGIAVGYEILYIIFSFGLIIFVSLAKPSRILSFLGKYSYEIFLLHGVFMIRYDFILFKGPLILTFWPFCFSIVLIAIAMQKMVFDRVSFLVSRHMG